MFFHFHSDKDIPKKGIRNALAAFAYVVAVALFMSGIQKSDSPDVVAILAPVGMLMLLVLSASVMGYLIFGAPLMLYIDGKKKEAVKLICWTIGSLAVLTVCMLSTFMVFGAP